MLRMAGGLPTVIMATASTNYCHKCGFKFCPNCGVKLHDIGAERTSVRPAQIHNRSGVANSSISSPNLGTNKSHSGDSKIPTFRSFKARKEAERSSFTIRSLPLKRVEEKPVVIQVGVLQDKQTVKRGESLPVRVLPSASSAKNICSGIYLCSGKYCCCLVKFDVE